VDHSREADGLGIGALRRAREARVKLVVNEVDLFRRSVAAQMHPRDPVGKKGEGVLASSALA
jgi:hypothetical protein